MGSRRTRRYLRPAPRVKLPARPLPGGSVSMRMLVLGAGLQGSACAFDLLQNPAVSEVRLADLNVSHLPAFLAPFTDRSVVGAGKPRLLPTPLDARDAEAVRAL